MVAAARGARLVRNLGLRRRAHRSALRARTGRAARQQWSATEWAFQWRQNGTFGTGQGILFCSDFCIDIPFGHGFAVAISYMLSVAIAWSFVPCWLPSLEPLLALISSSLHLNPLLHVAVRGWHWVADCDCPRRHRTCRDGLDLDAIFSTICVSVLCQAVDTARQ